MKNNSSWPTKLVFILVLSFAWVGLHSHQAVALTNTFPDNDDVTTVKLNPGVPGAVGGSPGGADTYVDVSDNNTGGLDAPDGIIRLYLNDNSQNITILSADNHDASGPCAGDSNGRRKTQFDLYYYNSPTNAVAYWSQNTSQFSACDVTIPPDAGAAPIQIGDKQFYVYELNYKSVGASSQAVNAFKLQIPRGVIAYTKAGSAKFAFQDRADTGSCDSNINEGCRRSTWRLYFGTDCNVARGAIDNKPIKWFDDDGDNPYVDEDGDGNKNNDPTLESTNPSGQRGIRMKLYDETAGAYVTINTTNGTGNIAKFGPSTAGQSEGIDFIGSHKYRMEWEGVSRSNGIQFQLPYDAIFHEVSCGFSPEGAVTVADCTAYTNGGGVAVAGISGWAFDRDDSALSLRVDIYKNGPYGAGGTYLFGGQADKFSGNKSPPSDINGTYNIDGQHRFSFDLSNYSDFNAHSFYAYTFDVDKNGTLSGERRLIGQVTVGPCATASCGGPSVTPGIPQPGQNFQVQARVNVGGFGGAGVPRNYSIILNMPDIPPGSWSSTGSVTSTGGSTTFNLSGPAGIKTGNNYQIIGLNPSPISCPMPDITIASKPYFRVYNGDISAGLSATAANPCTGWNPSSGTIYGWNNGAGVGAGTQLAAFALNAIDGVTSATNNTSLVTGSPKPAKGLSFANTVALEPFGGNFNKGSCPADYYATSTGATAKTGSGTPPTDRITSLNTGKYTYPGGIHLNGGNVSSNSKVTIYVDGDAYIDSDIQYPSNTWGDLKTMESFYVIVKGNIYISNLVNNLDGVYVAQPKADGTGGTIYTCYNNSGITDQAFIVSRCGAQGGGKPLLVNGALLAQSLRLLRSYGTQSSSSQTENTNPSTSTSAEIINYSPELWLTAPAPFDSGSTQTNFDAISTQAPIL